MLRKENILLVDDDIGILELLQRHLQSLNYHTYKAVSVKEAVRILKDTFIDLLITDIQMPEVDGLQLLKFTNEHYPEMPKLVVTGYPSVSGTLEGIKTGAIDYLTKPFTKQELKEAVENAFAHAKSQNQSVKKFPSTMPIYEGMIGDSEGFKKVTELIERVKNNKATVLITGESGTGKELVARAIHYSGKYARSPFVAVNCAALPSDLIESDLFGYRKGSFTGASEDKPGLIETASGGTLLLGEIASMPLEHQSRLLRVLQEKAIVRVGGDRTIPVDTQGSTGVVAVTRLIRTLRRELYDVAIDVQGLLRSAVIARWSGARRVVGFPPDQLRERAHLRRNVGGGVDHHRRAVHATHCNGEDVVHGLPVRGSRHRDRGGPVLVRLVVQRQRIAAHHCSDQGGIAGHHRLGNQ